MRMETLIHADVFFFITTIAVIVVALLIAAGLFYLVRILRDIQRIADLVRGAAEKLAGNVASWGEEVRNEGSFLHWLFRVAAKAAQRKGRVKDIKRSK